MPTTNVAEAATFEAALLKLLTKKPSRKKWVEILSTFNFF